MLSASRRLEVSRNECDGVLKEVSGWSMLEGEWDSKSFG